MRNPKSQKQPTWTVLDALRWTAGFFDSHQIDSPRLTAEILLAAVLRTTRVELYMRHDQPLAPAELAAYREMIRRRVRHEPAAYILREKQFWGLDFLVTPDVLIPRPETEHLVEAALDRLPEKDDAVHRVLDLGTGSGAIVICLAAKRPRHLYYASDRSVPALRVARQNAVRHGTAERIRFFCGDWLAPVNPAWPGFDLIVSNPPYVPSAEISRLAPEIRDHEPRPALDGDTDGLAAIGRIVSAAPDCLKDGGFLLVEIGWNQRAAVAGLCRRAGGCDDIEFVKDYAGHDRVAVLRKRP